MTKRKSPPPVVVDDSSFERLLQKAHDYMFSEPGRIRIPWPIVDEFLAANASGAMVAGLLGIHEDTLYNACQLDHNQAFRQYRARKKAAGDAMLLMAQFKSALAGDGLQLIWQGKNRLKQSEKPEDKKQGSGEGGYAILEIADNGRSVKDQNPLNKPEEAVSQDEEVDLSELD